METTKQASISTIYNKDTRASVGKVDTTYDVGHVRNLFDESISQLVAEFIRVTLNTPRLFPPLCTEIY